MSKFEDQKLACRDCGKEFIFSAGEQEFFSSRGFKSPVRCNDCRKNKKTRTNEPTQHTTTPTGALFEIKCTKCGKTTQVPFKPRNPEGILCSDCFHESKK